MASAANEIIATIESATSAIVTPRSRVRFVTPFPARFISGANIQFCSSPSDACNREKLILVEGNCHRLNRCRPHKPAKKISDTGELPCIRINQDDAGVHFIDGILSDGAVCAIGVEQCAPIDRKHQSRAALAASQSRRRPCEVSTGAWRGPFQATVGNIFRDQIVIDDLICIGNGNRQAGRIAEIAGRIGGGHSRALPRRICQLVLQRESIAEVENSNQEKNQHRDRKSKLQDLGRAIFKTRAAYCGLQSSPWKERAHCVSALICACAGKFTVLPLNEVNGSQNWNGYWKLTEMPHSPAPPLVRPVGATVEESWTRPAVKLPEPVTTP